MGSMNFTLPTTLPQGAEQALERVQFAGGYDKTPFPTGTEVTQTQLIAHKAQNESCTITLPWPIRTVGFPVTSSATLRERPEPYNLVVELARGKLNQLRNAIAELESQDVKTSPDVASYTKAATKALGRAVLQPRTLQTDSDAAEALQCAFSATNSLITQFTLTAIRLRCQAGRRIGTQWGCRITSVPTAEQTVQFTKTFNRVVIVPNWAEMEPASTECNWAVVDQMVEWAQSNNLPVTIGPLIDLGGELPEWLSKCEGEVASLAAYFSDFVESAIHRYRGRVKNWILCSGFNHLMRYGLPEDDRLRLVVRIIETARSVDPDGTWTVGLALPWGDYLQSDDHTYSPLVFADTLLRSGMPINGFELELFAGMDSRASLLRDGLETVRLVDLFGLLGTPIDIVARHPGRMTANPETEPAPNFHTLNGCWLARDTEAAQCEWGNWVSLLSLSYAHVRSFNWGAWTDLPQKNEFFGLVHHGTVTKPLLMNLTDYRNQCL
jgi:Glycosyl hydrolase family 10